MPTENPATPSDVKLERPLTSGETDVLPSWLDRAWRKLQDDVPGLAVRMLTEPPQDPLPPFPVSRETVIEVLVAMVERKLRNPDGLRSYGVDDSTTTIDAALSSGQIEATPAELDRLRPPAQRASGGGGLFSIQLGRG
jgi:hypothetical protein